MDVNRDSLLVNRQIKERPILFSGEMVRAILEDRKTKTRRILKELVSTYQKDAQGNVHLHDPMILHQGCWLKPDEWSPYGRPGDRLWVRESFNWSSDSDLAPNENHKKCKERAIYSAQNVVWKADGLNINPNHPEYGKTIWKPSIHMPRWASRILLEVVSVRVERVQDISESDAIAEGIPVDAEGFYFVHTRKPNDTYYNKSASGVFGVLWDEINLRRGYAFYSNPWVWVVEFKRIEVN